MTDNDNRCFELDGAKVRGRLNPNNEAALREVVAAAYARLRSAEDAEHQHCFCYLYNNLPCCNAGHKENSDG